MFFYNYKKNYKYCSFIHRDLLCDRKFTLTASINLQNPKQSVYACAVIIISISQIWKLKFKRAK